MPSPDDRRLGPAELASRLAAVRAGRTEQFGFVVRAYALPVRAYLAGRLHHREDVDDVAQDVFLAALEALPTYDPAADFWAWLRGIARHKALNHLRAGTRRGQALDRFHREVFRRVGDEFDRLTADDRAAAIERLLDCITRLPERLRAVVRAGLDGVKVSDLAAAMGTTAGAIYAMHYRANQALRACVERGGDGP